ncbi:hypothetical protein [Methylomagnum sp.]
MTSITCPACAAQVPDPATVCTRCGKPLPSSNTPDAPVRHARGKVLIIATLFLAAAVIATVMGAWWGPALLFPGAVVFMLGQFLA